MSEYKGFGIDGFSDAHEAMIRRQIDRIEKALAKNGVKPAPSPIQAEMEPGVSHPEYGDFCDYAQVAYFNPETKTIVLSGVTDEDREESIRHLPHEYAHMMDVVYLNDRAKDEWWAYRFMEYVSRGSVSEDKKKFDAHLLRAIAAMKDDGHVRVKAVVPSVQSKMSRRSNGPGKGWHRQRRRHAFAALKGWFGRRRR